MSKLAVRRLSRRQILKLSVAGAGAAVLAGFSEPSAPSAATQAPGKSAGLSGTLTVWNVTSFSGTADKAIGDVFTEWGSKNNVKVDYQMISSTGSEYKNRITAALGRRTPPTSSSSSAARPSTTDRKTRCRTSATSSGR